MAPAPPVLMEWKGGIKLVPAGTSHSKTQSGSGRGTGARSEGWSSPRDKAPLQNTAHTPHSQSGGGLVVQKLNGGEMRDSLLVLSQGVSPSGGTGKMVAMEVISFHKHQHLSDWQ